MQSTEENFNTELSSSGQVVDQNLEFLSSDILALGKKLASVSDLKAMIEDEKSTLNGEEELIVDLTEGCAAELFGGAPPVEVLAKFMFTSPLPFLII